MQTMPGTDAQQTVGQLQLSAVPKLRTPGGRQTPRVCVCPGWHTVGSVGREANTDPCPPQQKEAPSAGLCEVSVLSSDY